MEVTWWRLLAMTYQQPLVGQRLGMKPVVGGCMGEDSAEKEGDRPGHGGGVIVGETHRSLQHRIERASVCRV